MAAAAPAASPASPAAQEATERLHKAMAVNELCLQGFGERLVAHFRGAGPGAVVVAADFERLLYDFARAIDFALSCGDPPSNRMVSEIPGILRKVYQLRKDQFLQSSILVLVISCKNACLNKWFQPADCTDILSMADELSGNFCMPLSHPDNDVLQIISTIMPRYYPQLKLERLVTSLEAKVGYDILMTDFFIHRNLPRVENINLIVVQKENLDDSSCIAGPPQVSILVNGKGVDKRTNVSMETGPQFPTDITKMLKYGANIIQAIGHFPADYVIAVAFVNKLLSCDVPNLNDYAQPVTAYPPDSDILEGPSRVSLKCPISFRRIRTPIKGRLCKHYQCFDKDNYIKMNLRKPTWRCPCCNSPSNFTDLHIDQKMTKILHETADDIIDVLVFSDGSWKAVSVHDEKSDKHAGGLIQQNGDTIDMDVTPNVIDLTNENDDCDLPMSFASASEYVKLLLNSQDLSGADYLHSVGTSNSAFAMRHAPQGTHSGIVQSQPLFGLATAHHTVPRDVRREPVGVQVSQVPPQDPGPSRRVQPDIFNCPPPIPQSSSSSSTYQTHEVTNTDSCVAAMNTGGPLSRAPDSSSLWQLQSTHQDMRNTSNYISGHVSGFNAPCYMGMRPSQVSSGHARYANGNGAASPTQQSLYLDTILMRYRMSQLAQASPPQTVQAPQVLPITQPSSTNTNSLHIHSHLFSTQRSLAMRTHSVPRSASPQALPRAQSPIPPTVTPTPSPPPYTGTADGLLELPVDESWRPSGAMRGSLTGTDYNVAFERYV